MIAGAVIVTYFETIERWRLGVKSEFDEIVILRIIFVFIAYIESMEICRRRGGEGRILHTKTSNCSNEGDDVFQNSFHSLSLWPAQKSRKHEHNLARHGKI